MRRSQSTTREIYIEKNTIEFFHLHLPVSLEGLCDIFVFHCNIVDLIWCLPLKKAQQIIIKNFFIQRVYRGNNKRTWQSLIYIYPSETHDQYIWMYLYIDTWRWKLHFFNVKFTYSAFLEIYISARAGSGLA